MPRQINILTPLKIKSLSLKGIYHDGGGLYLQINPNGAKSWLFRFMLNGKARAMGLGTIQLVSLREARAKTLAMRKLLLEGIDPIDKRASERLVEDKPVIPTFDICADKYITEHEQTWKNEKHRAQCA